MGCASRFENAYALFIFFYFYLVALRVVFCRKGRKKGETILTRDSKGSNPWRVPNIMNFNDIS